MLVKEWMSKNLIAIDPGASLNEAVRLLNLNDISILPVLNDEKLVGVVTEMDLKPFSCLPQSVGQPALPSSFILARIRVEDIMSRAPVTVSEDFAIEEAADVLIKNRLHGLVVVDSENRVKGVITETDINRVMVSVTGLLRGGIGFGFLLEDRPGSIKVVTDVFRNYGGRLSSILTSYERAPKGYRNVHIRVRGLDRSKLDQLQEELVENATLLYKIDQRLSTREIFPEAVKHAETLAKLAR